MSDLRIGVLGSARIARTKVIPALRDARNCRVTTLATQRLDADERSALAAQLGVQVTYGYETVLEDEAIDAVYIPLPNHLHVPWSLAAVSAGKHVLCEKPIALNGSEARRLASAAEAAGVVLMEGFMYRFHPMWDQIRQAITDDLVGALGIVQSWFAYHNDDPGNIRNIAEFGGGALMDIGCYSVNLSRWLFGREPELVASVAEQADGDGSGVDIATSAVLGFAPGQATFTCATQAERDQGARLVGSRGRIEIPTPFGIPPDAPAMFDIVVDGTGQRYETPAANSFTLEFEAFADAVVNGDPSPLPIADAIANMDVLDRISTEWPHQRTGDR